MEKKIGEKDYIKKIKKHLKNPPKTWEEYFNFYIWFEDNEPENYTNFIDKVLEITEKAEPWTVLTEYQPLDVQLKKILKEYNY